MTDGSDNGKDNGKSKGRSVRERKIADVEIDLNKALRAERNNLFVIGTLLIEAKDKVAHGDWLPWLAKNFGRSVSTAYNYMSAARYLVKFPTVGNLKLAPDAIYWLARDHFDEEDEEEVYEQVEGEILKRAESEWIDRDFCERFLKLAAGGAAEEQRKREEESPTPDEPTRQGPRLVSSDDVSTSTPDEPEPDELTPEEAERELDQAYVLKLQGRFRSTVRAINELILFRRADLKAAGDGIDDWSKSLEKAANFLISFVETSSLNKKTRGVVELQRVQIEKQQAEIEKLRNRRNQFEEFLAPWLEERDKLGLLEDGQEEPTATWDIERFRQIAEEMKAERAEDDQS
jgi:hypothetical protein